MFSLRFGKKDRENCKMNANQVIKLSSLWRLKFALPTPQVARNAFCKRHPRFANQLASYFHTSSYNKFSEEESDRNRVGFLASLKNQFKSVFQDKQKAYTGALNLYMACADNVDLQFFLKRLHLPDTFNTWFLLTELHVWMCLVRVAEEGHDGRFTRNEVVGAMWNDVETRISYIDNVGSKSKHLKHLSQHFRAAIIAYDEGLLGNDKILAAALWRNLFSCKCDNPEYLELMVQYIRMQVSNLDSQPKEEIFNGNPKWLPFKELEALS